MPLTTPADLGFFMPAEWAPHTRCWMIWPHRADIWGGPSARQAARRAFVAVAAALARFEPVVMVAHPDDAAEARRLLGTVAEVAEAPVSDCWCRDSGPSFLIDGRGGLAGVDWGFNAWGMTYTDFAEDARVAGRILQRAGARRFAGPLILEGGSFSVDGQGTLLTTEQCLLNDNRNPHLTREDIETLLAGWLGISQVIWLGQGLENDETDGHVDEIACFAAPGRVLVLDPRDPADPNTATQAANIARLKAARDAQGRRLEVISLPQPAPFGNTERGRLTGSYANFYIANGGILCPAYDDPMDREAEQVLRAAFPDHQVVMVPAREIVTGGGNIHCITQQEPRA